MTSRRKKLTFRKGCRREYYTHRKLAFNSQTPSVCPSSSLTDCLENTSDVPKASQNLDTGPQKETDGPLSCVSDVPEVSSAADSSAEPLIPLGPLINTLKKHLWKVKNEERRKSGMKFTHGTEFMSSPSNCYNQASQSSKVPQTRQEIMANNLQNF